MGLAMTKVRVERFEALEERLRVRIEGCSAWRASGTYYDRKVSIYGELHLVDVSLLARAIRIMATIFDKQGEVVATDSVDFPKGSFYAFCPFRLQSVIPEVTISKVRVYPQSIDEEE